MTSPPRLAAIFRYSVKSLSGHALDGAEVDRCGIAGDRRWLVIDAAGRFVTRREIPAMALIEVTSGSDGLTLSHPVAGRCHLTLPERDAPLVEARIWRDTVPLRLAAPAVAAFLSLALERDVRLAYQCDAESRPVDPRFGHAGEHVSLADGFPLLVTTTGSLAALNERLPAAIGMARFRPNIVIDGTAAWAEDGWRRVRIGDVVLRVAKPCSRCVITTQDPLTGVRAMADEPLTTLRAMGRQRPGGIMFGQNLVPETTGTIRVGDAVVIERDD